MHSCENTAIKGCSWSNFWANLASFSLGGSAVCRARGQTRGPRLGVDVKVIQMPLYISLLCGESLMEYTGRRQNDVNVQGYPRRPSRAPTGRRRSRPPRRAAARRLQHQHCRPESKECQRVPERRRHRRSRLLPAAAASPEGSGPRVRSHCRFRYRGIPNMLANLV